MKAKATKGFDINELEEKVDRIASELKIDPEAWRRFMDFLAQLKRHNPSMYAHSLRVGIYSQGLAKHEHWSDSKFPFFGGCGHDFGKCLVSNRLLDAKHLSNRGYEKIKSHSYKGFEGLKDKFLFTAFIAGLHHKYQHGGYGINLEQDSPVPLDDTTVKTIHQTAELVALVDFFDALVTRHNDKGLIEHPENMDEAKTVMLKYFEPWHDRVEWLLENKLK